VRAGAGGFGMLRLCRYKREGVTRGLASHPWLALTPADTEPASPADYELLLSYASASQSMSSVVGDPG